MQATASGFSPSTLGCRDKLSFCYESFFEKFKTLELDDPLDDLSLTSRNRLNGNEPNQIFSCKVVIIYYFRNDSRFGYFG